MRRRASSASWFGRRSSWKRGWSLLSAVAAVAAVAALSPSSTAAPNASNGKSRAAGSRIDVAIEKIRSDKGRVFVALYDSPEGFPGSAKTARRSAQVAIRGGKAKATFDGVPQGTYAVAVMHDENGNGKLDTNFLGIPKEGIGASNDAQGKFGPADFDDAKFQLSSKRAFVNVKVVYFNLF